MDQIIAEYRVAARRKLALKRLALYVFLGYMAVSWALGLTWLVRMLGGGNG